jgi:20S proteasome subunit beta 5
MMVNLINHYKSYGLSMGLMLSGVDSDGPHLYYINTEGSRIKGDLFSIGSGMTYAYGVLDTFYRYEMSLEEAVELGRKAIYHATNRDTGSGGVVRVYHIHKDGWTEKVAGDDVNKLHYQYQAEKGLEEDRTRGKL